MGKRRKGRVRAWTRRYRYSLGLLGLAILSVAGWMTWYGLATQSSIEAQQARTIEDRAESARLAQVRRDKEAAEEKARQELAARQAAEQAKSGNTANLDATVCNASEEHNDPASIDVVVNKKHCIQPLGYVPERLVTAYGATLSDQVMPAFQQLYQAAAAAGQPFYVTSSYRSYTTQVTTYARWVSISGPEGADTYSARPGYSEHQTGFVIDVAANGCTLDCFGSTSQYQWFQAHAAEYGFIQRYYEGYDAITGYKAEEWHYRYVGTAVAQDMKVKNIKTLEEYWGVTGGSY